MKKGEKGKEEEFTVIAGGVIIESDVVVVNWVKSSESSDVMDSIPPITPPFYIHFSSHSSLVLVE